MDTIFHPDAGHSGYTLGWVDSWREGEHARLEDYVAEEVPVVLVYNNQPHVVMLLTPLDLEDFALGFSLTEGIIADASEARSIKVIQRAKGIEIRIKIPDSRFSCIQDQSRHMTGRTGCGLCGSTRLEQAIRQPLPVGAGLSIEADVLLTALNDMKQHQTLNRLTGSVHGAAWFEPEHGVTLIREDVGRHNALDKLIGVLARQKTDFESGCLLVTSRASYEMVQKAALVGITIMAAISAPTALAINLAETSGLTLVGFARKNQYVIYTHSQRILHNYTIAS
jgi:FdhD protein